MSQVNLSRLQQQLLTSGIQQTNNALYQVITQLLLAIIQLQQNVTNIPVSSGSGVTYVTQMSILGNDGIDGYDGPPGIPGIQGPIGPSGSGGGGNGVFIINDGIDGVDGMIGATGTNGRSLTIYEQADEPLDAVPGDLWITPPV